LALDLGPELPHRSSGIRPPSKGVIVTRPNPFPMRLFLSGFAGFMLIGTVPALYGVAVPHYGRVFGLDNGEASMLLGAHCIGALAAVVGGMFGLSVLTLRLSFMLVAVGAAVVASEAHYGFVLIGAVVLGAGFGLISALINQRFLAGFGVRGPGMIGMINAIYGIGAILSPILFVWAGGAPWMVFAGIAGIAGALIALAEQGDGRSAASGLPDLRDRKFALLAFIFIAVVIEVALFGFGPSAMIAQGATEFGAARLTSGFFTAFLLGLLSLYWLTRWAGADLLFLLAMIGVVVTCGFAAMGWPATGFVASGAFIGMTFPTFYVWGSTALGTDGRIGAAILAAGLVGGTTAPSLLRLVLGQTGVDALFLMLTILAAGMVMVLWPVITMSRPKRPAAKKSAGHI